MTTYLESLLKLSRNERFLIVQALLDSLQDEEQSEEFELSEAWEKEIERRSDLIDKGDTQLLPREEVMGQ